MPARDLARSAWENLPSDADFTPASLHNNAASPAPAFALANYAYAAHALSIDADFTPASLHDNAALPPPAIAFADDAHAAHAAPNPTPAQITALPALAPTVNSPAQLCDSGMHGHSFPSLAMSEHLAALDTHS